MSKIRVLNEELQKTAIEQLNEVPERIPQDLETLRTWIKQQPHLKARTDDQFLIAFLRGCKYSLEKTKAKIDKYYTLKTKYPEIFRQCTEINTKRFREIFRLGIFTILPTPLNKNGPRLCLMRVGHYSPDDYKVEEIMGVVCAIHDIMLLEDDYALINGLVGVIEFENSSLQHILAMGPSISKKMTIYSEEALPFRPKGSHFINTIAGLEPFFNLIKPMMSKKQQERLWIHGKKMEALYEHVPKKYLPKEYGGENSSIAEMIIYWEKKLDEYSEYFKNENEYGTVEKLRPGKPIDFNQLFGLEGSFRKLDID